MQSTFDREVIPNVLIGGSFVFMSFCIGWLWNHRRGDWPKAWTLALLFCCLFSCGVSRYLHGTGSHPKYISASDWVTAFFAVVAACLFPWAVYVISKFPTPKQVEHAIRGNAQRHFAEAAAEQAKRRKDRAEHQASLLLGLFKQTTLPSNLKEQVESVIAELRNDSDDTSSSPVG